MSPSRFDLAIIGGGIIGLAAALEAGRRFPQWSLAVFEKEDRVGAHQTGHNSGVIHAGLYYKPGSVKALTRVEGAAAMVAFCREHGIPYELIGKVVVATGENELNALEELYRRGQANGIPIRRKSVPAGRTSASSARGPASPVAPVARLLNGANCARLFASGRGDTR